MQWEIWSPAAAPALTQLANAKDSAAWDHLAYAVQIGLSRAAAVQ
jgi:hypothetical protein